jgi:hypothetical protein
MWYPIQKDALMVHNYKWYRVGKFFFLVFVLFSYYRLYEPPVVHEDGLVLDFCGGQPCFYLVSQSLQQEI